MKQNREWFIKAWLVKWIPAMVKSNQHAIARLLLLPYVIAGILMSQIVQAGTGHVMALAILLLLLGVGIEFAKKIHTQQQERNVKKIVAVLSLIELGLFLFTLWVIYQTYPSTFLMTVSVLAIIAVTSPISEKLPYLNNRAADHMIAGIMSGWLGFTLWQMDMGAFVLGLALFLYNTEMPVLMTKTFPTVLVAIVVNVTLAAALVLHTDNLATLFTAAIIIDGQLTEIALRMKAPFMTIDRLMSMIGERNQSDIK